MITINQYVCGSCAVASIATIGSCTGPEDVLKRFCKTELGERSSYRKDYRILTSYYVFCAGPEVTSKAKGGSHHSKDHWPRYGTELAAYILSNGLGEVVTVGPKKNLKHHKDTTAQVWVWSPDQKAMERWWDTHYSEETPAARSGSLYHEDDAGNY